MIVASARFTGIDVVAIIAVFLLLGVSAVLALAETGLVRTSKARARSLESERHRGARSLRRLAEDPEKFLSPVLLLVLICQLIVGTIVSLVASRLFGEWGVVAGLVFEITVIFVFAEAIPKDWAVRHPDRAALFAAPFVSAIIRFPPVKIISTLLIGLAHRFTPGGHGDDVSEITESELLAHADVAVAEDVIAHEERALISSIIDFGDTVVREVMSPRPDIVAVESETTAEEVLERAMNAGLSRIPVFKKSLDDIVGIAYTRDLIRSVRDGQGATKVETLCRAAHYVPETKKVAPLLREMQSKQFHLAVAIDEYGGTAGIVTLEDLIEELVGEIADEFDVDEPLVEALGEDDFRVSAKMAVDEVNELLDADLPVGDWDSVGGLFLHLRGQIPIAGESVEAAGHRLVAERVQGRRIATIRILRTSPRATTDGEADREP